MLSMKRACTPSWCVRSCQLDYTFIQKNSNTWLPVPRHAFIHCAIYNWIEAQCAIESTKKCNAIPERYDIHLQETNNHHATTLYTEQFEIKYLSKSQSAINVLSYTPTRSHRWTVPSSDSHVEKILTRMQQCSDMPKFLHYIIARQYCIPPHMKKNSHKSASCRLPARYDIQAYSIGYQQAFEL